MDYNDFIDDRFNDQDPCDLKILIDFLEKNENQKKLFQFWDTLDNNKLANSISDEIYEGIFKRIKESDESIYLRNETPLPDEIEHISVGRK